MSYTDFDCGIKEAHWHTGEIVTGYFIEYWCPTMTAWTTNGTSYGARCTCTEPHLKARIQHTTTEIIEIVPTPTTYDMRPSEFQKAADEFMEEFKRAFGDQTRYFFFYERDDNGND